MNRSEALEKAIENTVAFDAKWTPEPNSGCHIWIGTTATGGYGRLMCHGHNIRAHHVSFLRCGGIIPPGMVIDHLCRNRCCVNPAHLRAVTTRENNLFNSLGPTAINANKTNCLRGHPLSGGNLRLRGNSRICKQCQNEHTRKWRTRINGLVPTPKDDGGKT